MVKTFTAICMIIGAIVGAGYLGIPYVVSQSGFPIGVFHLVIIATLMAIAMLYLGEIVLRTKTTHQLAGYAEKYLGHKGKIIMFLSFMFGAYAALLAYMIAEGESISLLLFGSTKYAAFAALLFWVVISFLAHKGIKTLKKSESLGVTLVFIMLISIVLLNAKKITIENISYTSTSNLFLPLGVIMFSFLGYSIIPEVKRMLGKQTHVLKKAIIAAYAIIFFIYLIFTLVVVGSYGLETPQIATFALGKPFILLGIITIFTASLALSNALIDSLRFDFGASKQHAWMYAMFVPAALYILTLLTGNINFITTITVGGIISGTITLILIILMIPKAKKVGKNPEYSMPYSSIIAWMIIIVVIITSILELSRVLLH